MELYMFGLLFIIFNLFVCYLTDNYGLKFLALFVAMLTGIIISNKIIRELK